MTETTKTQDTEQSEAPESKFHEALEKELRWHEESIERMEYDYYLFHDVVQYIEQEYGDSLVHISHLGHWVISLTCSTLEEAGSILADICRTHKLRIQQRPNLENNSFSQFEWMVSREDPKPVRRTLLFLTLRLSPKSCERVKVGEKLVPEYKVVCK